MGLGWQLYPLKHIKHAKVLEIKFYGITFVLFGSKKIKFSNQQLSHILWLIVEVCLSTGDKQHTSISLVTCSELIIHSSMQRQGQYHLRLKKCFKIKITLK
jgi:hypothetical protein